LLSGSLIAIVLSLAYLFFGAWDIIRWSPEPLWAQILFFPGVAAGQLCWNHLSHSKVVCYAVGVAMMGTLGALIGLVSHVAIRRRQSNNKCQ
jgi:hypothetical protein